jgi:hypothetical protein
MVTWLLSGPSIPAGDVWYIAGFENGTDFDFNDYAFVFQNIVPTPEPGSILLVAVGLMIAGLATGLRPVRQLVPIARNRGYSAPPRPRRTASRQS